MPRARLHPYSRDQGPLYIQPPNPRAQRALMVPANAPSCVKVLIAAMKSAGHGYDAVAEASVVLRSTMKSWRHRVAPSFATIEACYNAIGWHFLPCPKIEVLPEDIAADLARLAAKMKAEIPEVWSALAELAAAFLRERGKERIEAREAGRDAPRIARNTTRAANDNTAQSKSDAA